MYEAAIEISSRRVRLASRKEGIKLDTSSAGAYREDKLIAIGGAAEEMTGRVPAAIRIKYPVEHGSIVCRDLCSEWLTRLLKPFTGVSVKLTKPDILIVDTGLTDSAKEFISARCDELGAGKVTFLSAGITAALGARCPVMKPEATVLLDVGACSMDGYVLAYGSVVKEHHIPYGTDSLNDEIRRQVLEKCNLKIGNAEAENLKHVILTSMPSSRLTAEAEGISTKTGFPVRQTVSSEDIFTSFTYITAIARQMVASLLSSLPEGLAAEAGESGIMLTGGGALLPSFAKGLSDLTGVQFHRPEEPLQCTIRGAYRIISEKALEEILLPN